MGERMRRRKKNTLPSLALDSFNYKVVMKAWRILKYGNSIEFLSPTGGSQNSDGRFVFSRPSGGKYNAVFTNVEGIFISNPRT